MQNSGKSQFGSANPNWKGGKKTVVCRQCGIDIQVIPAVVATRKFCSKKCQAVASIGQNNGAKSAVWKGGPEAAKRRHFKKTGRLPKSREFTPRTCKGCGKIGLKKGRFYHPECRPAPAHPSVEVLCAECGKKRKVNWQTYKNRYPIKCRQCELLSRKGNGNSNWRGGITTENHKIRASPRYIRWRKAVFKRDAYTCVACGQVGGKLNADHIKPFSTYPHLRFKRANGRTLCEACHKETPTYMMKVRNHQAEMNALAGFLPFRDLGLA